MTFFYFLPMGATTLHWLVGAVGCYRIRRSVVLYARYVSEKAKLH